MKKGEGACLDQRVLAVAGLLLIVLWAGTFAIMWQDHRQTIAAAVKENENLVRAFEEHVTTLLQGLDQALQLVRVQHTEHADNFQLAEIVRQVGLPRGIAHISIIDEHGNLAQATLPFGHVRLADREYYRFHLKGTADTLYISQPVVDRITGKSLMQLSRRLTKSNGEFGGVLVLSLDSTYFADFYRTVHIGDNGVVSLVGLDGVTRARQSGQAFSSGKDVRGKTLFKKLELSASGTYRTLGKVDGVPRFISYRAMKQYPFVVLVGVAVDDVLENSRSRRNYLLVAVLGVTAVVSGGAFRIARMMAIQERSAAELQNSRAQLHAFMNSVADIGWMKDAEGSFVAVNKAFLDWFDVPEQEVIGRTSASIVGDELSNQFHVEAERVMQTGQISRFETKLVHRDEVRWLETIKAPVYGGSGTLFGTCGVSRDITERKKSEAATVEANRILSERTAELMLLNKDLEAFTYTVSHDLRAPLRHMSGFANLLRDALGVHSDSRAARLFEKIERAVHRMTSLIDDLLAFSLAGRSRLSREPVSLEEVVRKALNDIVGDQGKRKVNWHIKPLPDALGDADLLKIAFSNILSNAIKYTSRCPDPRIEVAPVSCSANECTVYVKDNGIGFDMADADRIFDVFVRLHTGSEFEGTGIGMATVRRIVDRHGGRIWAEGRRGAGATFYVTLPLAARS